MISRALPKLIFLLVILLSNQLWAYDIPSNTREYATIRNSFSIDGGTAVDPFSGNVSLSHTDLSIPGTAGLGINITRTYNAIDKDSDSILGSGWGMEFGTLVSDYNGKFRSGDCSSDHLIPKKMTLKLSGQQITFYIYDNGPSNNQYDYISSSNWVAKCLDNGGLEAYSPDGLRYRLGWMFMITISQIKKMSGKSLRYWITTVMK